jgi:hypothetical protein
MSTRKLNTFSVFQVGETTVVASDKEESEVDADKEDDSGKGKVSGKGFQLSNEDVKIDGKVEIFDNS